MNPNDNALQLTDNFLADAYGGVYLDQVLLKSAPTEVASTNDFLASSDTSEALLAARLLY